MEIDKIQAGQYTSYKVKETDETKETGENTELKQEMTEIANQFYADVTAVSTDEDAVIATGDDAVADKDTYNIVKNYVNSVNGTGETSETEEAVPVSETDEAAKADEVSGDESVNTTFADKDEVSTEVESLIKDMKAQLKAKGATDEELSKLNYLSAHFDAETFLNDNPEATLNDLEDEIAKEVEKLTGKSL